MAVHRGAGHEGRSGSTYTPTHAAAATIMTRRNAVALGMSAATDSTLVRHPRKTRELCPNRTWTVWSHRQAAFVEGCSSPKDCYRNLSRI
jgi:hypothetical protein